MLRRSVKGAVAAAVMVGGAALGWLPPTAHAQDTLVEQSLELGYAGLARFAEGRWSEALATFETAERLSHSPVFVLYIARSRRNLNELLAARDAYRRLTAEVLSEDAPAAWHEAQTDGAAELAALESRIPRVVVELEGAEALDVALRIDARVISAGQPEQLDPGSYRVVAEHPTLGTREEWITVKADEPPRHVVLRFGAMAPEAAKPDSVPALAPPPEPVAPTPEPPSVARWGLELSAGVPLTSALGGVTTTDCDLQCERSLGAGFDARLAAIYEMTSLLGLGFQIGGVTVAQQRSDRPQTIVPIGKPANEGVVTDRVRISGLQLGGLGVLSIGRQWVGQLRMGIGLLAASTSSERTGAFTSSSGVGYDVGPIGGGEGAVFLTFEPELRAGVALGRSWLLTLGAGVPIYYAFGEPEWDGEDPFVAADDGQARFEREPLIGTWLVFVAPRIGLRFSFDGG